MTTGVYQFFLGYGMNSILSNVRCLSLITHLMMMQLNYPANCVIFYGVVFNFVTFDVLPTEGLYGEIFGFVNIAYSEQAANIGYESHYAISNSGSIPIFMLFNFVL